MKVSRMSLFVADNEKTLQRRRVRVGRKKYVFGWQDVNVRSQQNHMKVESVFS